MARTAPRTGDLVDNIPYNLVPCALVLENEPVGDDSRLQFESFPDQIEEAYAVNAYREIAADRMSQPGYVAYRGGNWSSFALELKFRAERLPNRQIQLDQLSTNDIEGILIDMERKVRWCQALAFPLERQATDAIQRVQRLVSTGGPQSALAVASLSQLTRNDPPIVFVVFGSFLVLRCYVTNYSLRWEGPFHPLTAQPYGCTVTLTFQRLEREYPTWNSIRNSAGTAQQSPAVARLQGTVTTQIAALRAQDARRNAANANVALEARNSATALFGGAG